MQVAIAGKNIELTAALRGHVQRKLAKLDRYFEEPPSAQVTLAVEHTRHIVEVTVPLAGWLLRAEAATGDMYASVDEVVDKLERQIHKYKTRLVRKPRREAGAVPAAEEPAPDPDDGAEAGGIVRVKRFALKPMPPEEAVLQMDLLGHDFFVFRDADAGGRVSVVYRRRGGGYGLIEPEL